MKVDEPTNDESYMLEAGGELASENVPSDTYAAKWARPAVKPFSSSEKALTFQVRDDTLSMKYVRRLKCLSWQQEYLNALHSLILILKKAFLNGQDKRIPFDIFVHTRQSTVLL